MKNFILVEAPLTSEARYLLLHLDPDMPDELREFKPFTHYTTWLASRGYAPNTVKLYAEHVGRFVDYVYEASQTPFAADVEVTIETVINSYPAYLLFGKGAANPIALKLAGSLGKEKLTGHNSIAETIESSINWFLQVSETKNRITPDKLFSPFYTKRAEYRSQYEISAHKANSWLAAVIRDSIKSVLPKRKRDKLFPQAARRDRKNDQKPFKTLAFPIEQSVNLIRQAKPAKSKTFYRDMTLYSLLAATGARSSEALQVRMPDIDDDEFAVFLRDPFARKTPGITEDEYQFLSWKGRVTEMTFMIEPFAGMFWENLEKYLTREYNSSVGHDFLFQNLDGRPFFASDRSSRDKTFKSYAKKAGVEDVTSISAHSLRHMYGTYTLNYLPVPGQSIPGLPLTYVKILMGHASASSTMKYAKHDTDIIEAYIQHANQYVSQRGEASFRTIRADFHFRQLELLEEEAKRIEGEKMINLTKDVLIIKSGEDLERSIKEAIAKAKACVAKALFESKHIAPSEISSGSVNEYYQASVLRFFNDHLDPVNAPVYDEDWVHNLYTCTKKTPDAKVAKQVIPKTAHDWINKSSLERLAKDSILILHFLWQEKAVLLPLDTKKPTGGHQTKKKHFEFAAADYTEVLALVSKPFVPHITYENILDITTVMKPSAIKNFEWYAWRMIRATDWHRIEDINPKDISDVVDHLTKTRRGEVSWFMYPIAPGAFLSYVQKLYPERCQQTTSLPKNDLRASTKALRSGEFSFPAEHQKSVDLWLKYQGKFIQLQKSRGMKTFRHYESSFTVLNTYLFSEYPEKTGLPPPGPQDLNRTHLEGDGYVGLLSYLRKGRSGSAIQKSLYHIEALFDYLTVNSSADDELAGFVNPISDIDYPIVSRSSGTNKPAFESEHFPILLQYCYAVESFTTHLADRVYEEQINLYDKKFRADIPTKNWNEAQKVVQTEKLGYVPVVFYRNPDFDASQPKSDTNRPMKYEALHLLPRFVVPIIEHSVERKGEWVFYPQLNYIRHNIIALETGVRSIHIRWLERLTYDMHIDRSRPLPPLCKLRINTDKANGPWDSTVSRSVIDVLDRQKAMIKWFNDPAMDVPVWYDYHEESPFGKITSLFPKGETPGVLTGEAYGKYFKRLVYSFDLFCRFQLGINTTNAMPEAVGDLDSIDEPVDYLAALKLEAQACKLIEHTPHSCRVSVVSEYIRVLPPHIIGAFITGQATEEHVMYYAKVDPAYLKSVAQYQKMSVEQGWLIDRPAMSNIKAEDISSKLQQAFRRDKDKSLIDFGAISFDREMKDDVLSGVRAAKQRPIDSLAFMPTHICPFGNHCPADVVKDLGAIPGLSTPCGGCYYSVKTVDHLPRIHGHIRALTDECSELEAYIAEAKRNGASVESLVQKASRRKFLATEIISWSVTAHCLEQMYSEIKTRESFLVEKPEIVSEHLERLELKEHSLSNLIARTAEAKSHAEYFTPQLNQQLKVARNKLLAFTGDFNRMLEEAPTGFTLIDEFRGLIRSACEVLGISLHDLSDAMSKPMALNRPDSILKLISSPGSVTA